jgi:transposase InsO family protein
LYLTTVIDLFDRKVVAWSLSEMMKAQDTSLATLKIAKLHCPLKDHESKKNSVFEYIETFYNTHRRH